MSDIEKAITSVNNSELAFCKFLSANDTGKTGGHQCGIYISKPAIRILFDEPGKKGTNKDKFVTIHWMDNQTTDSRFIYYGRGTRNEYRITNFGRGFPYLKPNFIGSLFVLTVSSSEKYEGFIIDNDEDIQSFLSAFAISATETNTLIKDNRTNVLSVYDEILAIIKPINDFPDSKTMSKTAREIFAKSNHSSFSVDDEIIEWIDTEFKLYRALEDKVYLPKIVSGFSSVNDFEALAAQLMNRRKSRAGKSLENHLEEIFRESNIDFETQVRTEGNKTSDFVFPSSKAYHDPEFPVDKIITLGAKTTCKDRWRQVLNEANRVRNRQKFLCTLQQGISESQLNEMEFEKLTLVVPKKYIPSYPRAYQDKIWTIEKFIDFVKKAEAK